MLVHSIVRLTAESQTHDQNGFLATNNPNTARRGIRPCFSIRGDDASHKAFFIQGMNNTKQRLDNIVIIGTPISFSVCQPSICELKRGTKLVGCSNCEFRKI